jgi:uncharacterized protein (DUF488 family)
MTPRKIWTVGHGNRSFEELLQLLESAGISCLADVRAFPASRKHPHFSRAALEPALRATGVDYVWLGKALGGFRKPPPKSRHAALRNDSFRGYAHHMETETFKRAAQDLIERAARQPIALMCAERLPWQCHRNLIADYLIAQDVEVIHLIGAGAVRRHQLSDAATISAGAVTYDKATQLDLGLD